MSLIYVQQSQRQPYSNENNCVQFIFYAAKVAYILQNYGGHASRYGAPLSMNGGASGSHTPSQNSTGGGGDLLSKTNLYIRGLNPNTTDRDLVNLCQGLACNVM